MITKNERIADVIAPCSVIEVKLIERSRLFEKLGNPAVFKLPRNDTLTEMDGDR